MATEPAPPTPQREQDEWQGDFDSMRDRARDAALASTPSQRLAWLEEAISLATKMGALPRRDGK